MLKYTRKIQSAKSRLWDMLGLVCQMVATAATESLSEMQTLRPTQTY